MLGVRRPIVLILAFALFACPATLAVRAADAKPEPAVPVLPPPKDVGELRQLEERFKQVSAKVVPSVVALRIGASQGSGVVVTKDGLVLTAGHVTDAPGKKLTVIFPSGKTAQATSLGVSRDTDAGLVKIDDAGDWPTVEMAKAAGVHPGDWCLAVGHPLGHMSDRPPVVRAGRVLQARETVLQTDCPIVAGDSGGPVFNLQGEVIGINSRITAGQMSMNFHVPIDVYHSLWPRLLKGELLESKVAGKGSDEVKGVFRPAASEAGRCVVRVKCDGKDAVLGTIVGPDGWIVTKASQLQGKIVCRTRDGQEREAKLVGVNPIHDLAMLKIDATGLPTIPWAETADSPVGRWVISPGLEDGSLLAVGVVGVPKRRIPHSSGTLGVVMVEQEDVPRIERILPESAAQKAGLQTSDLILEVNKRPVRTRLELINAIKEFRPGATVKLTVRRGDKTLEVPATLTRLTTPATQKRDHQNLSGTGISDRFDDFPSVLQHDSVLAPTDCGGPVVNLDGRVMGVNIARAGRTETYAIPTEVLLASMYDLMSGRLAPKPEAKPEPKPEAKPAKPEAKPEPKPAPAPPKPENKPESKAEAKPEPSPPKPEAKPQSKPENKPEAKPEPKPSSTLWAA